MNLFQIDMDTDKTTKPHKMTKFESLKNTLRNGDVIYTTRHNLIYTFVNIGMSRNEPAIVYRIKNNTKRIPQSFVNHAFEFYITNKIFPSKEWCTINYPCTMRDGYCNYLVLKHLICNR